jgi:O-antigen/teichoic acid export membrane protein
MAGQEFAGAYPLLVLLGIAASVELIGVSFEPLLMATGHARASVTIKLVNALFLFALLAVLLPRFGPMGAATANIAVAVAGFFAMGIAARRYSRNLSKPA